MAKAGYFDGPLAWQVALAVLPKADGERTKLDKDFYSAAEALQLSHPLKPGCSGEEYSKRAGTWIHRIMPNLGRPCPPGDASDYVLQLMPANLREAGRRIKSDLKREGSWLNLAAVTRACRTVVDEEQATPNPTPSFVSLTASECGAYAAIDLATLAGVSLSSVRGSTANVGSAFAATVDSWCDKCPKHGRDGTIGPDRCLHNPGYSGEWPLSLYTNKEKREGIERSRAHNAKKAGVPLLKMTAPSAEAIKKFKEGRQRRSAERNGRKPAEEGTPGGIAAGAGVKNFMDSIRDAQCGAIDMDMLVEFGGLGELAYSFPAVVEEGAGDDGDDDEDDDGDSSLLWFVLVSSDGSTAPEVQSGVSADQLEFDRANVAVFPVPFLRNELQARAYLATLTAADDPAVYRPMTPAALRGASTSACGSGPADGGSSGGPPAPLFSMRVGAACHRGECTDPGCSALPASTPPSWCREASSLAAGGEKGKTPIGRDLVSTFNVKPSVLPGAAASLLAKPSGLI